MREYSVQEAAGSDWALFIKQIGVIIILKTVFCGDNYIKNNVQCVIFLKCILYLHCMCIIILKINLQICVKLYTLDTIIPIVQTDHHSIP